MTETSEITFCNKTIDSSLTCKIDIDQYTVDFDYVEYTKVRHYFRSFGFKDEVFVNVPGHLMEIVFKDLFDKKNYTITEDEKNNSITIKFNYEFYGKKLPIMIVLNTKDFEGNEQLLADNKKLTNDVARLRQQIEDIYLLKYYTCDEIVTKIPDFWLTFHRFMMDNDNNYVTEYNKTTAKTIDDFLVSQNYKDWWDNQNKHILQSYGHKNGCIIDNKISALLTFVSLYGYNIWIDNSNPSSTRFFIKNGYRLYYHNNTNMLLNPKTFKISGEKFAAKCDGFYLQVSKIL